MMDIGQRRGLPLAAWPEGDRQRWIAGQSRSYVAALQPSTVRVLIEGYGRWLAGLAAQGSLIAGTSPADRVTPATVRTYTDQLRALGNTKRTIDGRLGQLATVMRILAPERSFTWLHPSRQPDAGRGRRHRGRSDEERVAEWPAVDRQLWQAGFQADDALSPPGYGLQLRPTTVRTIIQAYEQWLRFLKTQMLLDPSSLPANRLTRDRAVAFVTELQRSHGNASIITRLTMLRTAFRIMQPEVDLGWLTAPGGRSLTSLLPVVRKPIQIIDSKVLYDWGHALMQEALADPNPDRRRLGFRDGLLIALFAARAPRVRSMASLRLGHTVLARGSGYRLLFEGADVKTGRSIEYEAPLGLGDAITRYIERERAELVGQQTQDAFWVNEYGEPLQVGHVAGIIRARSKARFGHTFGPHRFRHALGTTAPLVDPAHPGVAAGVLGITGRMVERHYNRARQVDVAGQWQASLHRQRTEAQTLANNLFRQRRKG